MMDDSAKIYSGRRVWLGLFMAVVLLAAFALAGCSPAAAPTEAPQEEPSEPESGPKILPTTAPPTALPTQAAQARPTPLPAIPERRTLSLEWPPTIRVGDAELVILTLEVDQEGVVTATAQTPGNEVVTEVVEIPNLYETHNVLIEARLDMAGMEYAPPGDITEALLPGKKATFMWSVRPAEVGRYKGTIWLHLRFLPKQGGPEERIVLSAQVVEIQAVNLFGLGGKAARVVGGVGAVLGSFLSLDNLLPALWKIVNRKRKNKSVD